MKRLRARRLGDPKHFEEQSLETWSRDATSMFLNYTSHYQNMAYYLRHLLARIFEDEWSVYATW